MAILIFKAFVLTFMNLESVNAPLVAFSLASWLTTVSFDWSELLGCIGVDGIGNITTLCQNQLLVTCY